MLPFVGTAQIKFFTDPIFKEPLPDSIPLKSKTVKISGRSFIEICNGLLDAGYELEKKDSELQTVQNKSVEYMGLGVCYTNIISVRVRGDTSYLNGKYYLPYNGLQSGYYLEKQGNPKKTVDVMAFLDAYLFAKKISNNLF